MNKKVQRFEVWSDKARRWREKNEIKWKPDYFRIETNVDDDNNNSNGGMRQKIEEENEWKKFMKKKNTKKLKWDNIYLRLPCWKVKRQNIKGNASRSGKNERMMATCSTIYVFAFAFFT